MPWPNIHLKSSLLSMLGSTAVLSTLRQGQTEQIRSLMLDELGEFGEANFPKIVHHVRYAIDAQTLWFLRSEVMTVLGAMHGELIAREKLRGISEKFKGLLPKGLNSRASPLKE